MKIRLGKSVQVQTGFTLIEIMIALLLGVVLISGIIQIFLSAKQSYRMQEALSRLQENGRFAMDFIARDVRMADYRDCPSDRVTSLYKMAGGTSTTMPGTAAVSGTNGATDTLSLTWTMQACGTATPTNKVTYSIATSGGQPSLMQNGTQIIEGVEDMQVLYGVNTDSDTVDPAKTPNYYTTAPAAGSADWEKVTSIRVSLLLRTVEDRLTSQQITYKFNGVTTSSADGRIRRVMTSTFAVRNRLPT